MTFLIRAVRPSDIADLQQQCWPDSPSAYVLDLVNRAIRLRDQKRGGAMVAVWDGRIIGYGLLTIWTNMGEISDLMVATNHRNNGIGSCIIANICTLAWELGVWDVEIGAFSDNIGAIRLYERLGFVKHRTLVVQSGKPPQVIIYLYKRLSVSS